MALDVSALSTYTDENRNQLISSTVSGAKSAKLLNLQTGYKSAGAINIMDSDVVFQNGAADGRIASGSTTLTQRILTVGHIAVSEDINPRKLEAYWTQHLLKEGSTQDAVPFEEAWVNRKVEKIADALETAIWQGDTESGTVNLSYFDGLLKHIDSDSVSGSIVNGNTGNVSGSITTSNVEAIFDGIYESIPTQVLTKDDVVSFCGYDTYRIYTQALKNSNLFHYDANGTDFEIVLPGTNVKIVAVAGLNGTNRIITARTSGLIVGTDLEHEDEEISVWYSKDDKAVKFDTSFKYGTQIAFPEEIVSFKLSS